MHPTVQSKGSGMEALRSAQGKSHLLVPQHCMCVSIGPTVLCPSIGPTALCPCGCPMVLCSSDGSRAWAGRGKGREGKEGTPGVFTQGCLLLVRAILLVLVWMLSNTRLVTFLSVCLVNVKTSGHDRTEGLTEILWIFM